MDLPSTSQSCAKRGSEGVFGSAITNRWSCRLRWSAGSNGCRRCGSLRAGDSAAQLNSMLWLSKRAQLVHVIASYVSEKGGDAVYKEAVVMYTDILGFKELVKSSDSKTVYRILNLFAMPFKSGVLDSIAHDTNQYFTLDQLDEKYIALTKQDDDEDGVAAQVKLLDEADGKRRCYIF